MTVERRPNPPIAEEFGGMWTSQPRADAEETPWEGMSVPSGLVELAGGHFRLCGAKEEGTPG